MAPRSKARGSSARSSAGGCASARRARLQRPRRSPSRAAGSLYLGYELAQEIEPRLALPPTPLPWVAFALRMPCALIHELASGRVLAVAEAGAAAELERLEADARAAAQAAEPPDALEVRGVAEEEPQLFLARRSARPGVRARRGYLPGEPLAPLERRARGNAPRCGRRRRPLPAPARGQSRAVRSHRAMARRGAAVLISRATGARRRSAHRHAADRRHPPAQPPPGGRCAGDPRPRHASQGARRAHHAGRPRAQRPRAALRAGQRAGRRAA